MTRRILMTGLLALLAGCGSSVPQAKQEAYHRWHNTRARVLYGVAVEQFKVGDLDQARNRVTEALALNGDDLEARTLLGKIDIEQSHWRLAIDGLQSVIEFEPNNVEARYLLAVAQENAGLKSEALSNYRYCHAIDQRNMEAVSAAAEVLVSLRRLDEAQAYIESYVRETDATAAMYEIAGRIAVMLDQPATAASHYQQACDMLSDNIPLRESLARAQFAAGQFAEAMDSFEKLQSAEDYELPVWALTMMGDCQMDLGQPREARDLYYRATELETKNPGVWTNLAKASLATGDPQRAAIAARRAISLNGANLDAALLLAYAMLADNQPGRAVSVLVDAVSEHPNSPMVHCLLGRAYQRQGKAELAERSFASALAVDPEYVLAKELLIEARGNSSRAD